MAAIRTKHVGKKLVKRRDPAEDEVFKSPPPPECHATAVTGMANTLGSSSDVTTPASSTFMSTAATQAENDSDLSPVPSDNEFDESIKQKSIANMTQSAVSSMPSISNNPKHAAAPVKKPRRRTTKKTNGF